MWCECGHTKDKHGFFSDHDECYECDQASPDLCCEWRPVARPDTQLEHLQSQLEQLRAENEALRKEVANSEKYQAQLLDSDSQAAAHDTSNLLRRLKDFLFENCNHSDRDRNYDWCPSCVMGFMEVVARPSNADAATTMRDKCVVHLQASADALDVRQETECPSGTAFNSEATLRRRIAADLKSLTLDQVKPGEM